MSVRFFFLPRMHSTHPNHTRINIQTHKQIYTVHVIRYKVKWSCSTILGNLPISDPASLRVFGFQIYEQVNLCTIYVRIPYNAYASI